MNFTKQKMVSIRITVVIASLGYLIALPHVKRL